MLLTAGVTLAAGASATVALAGGSEPEAVASTQATIAEVSTPLPVLSRRQVAATAPMDPSSAQGYRLTTRDATVWVVRDDTGAVCLVDGQVVACGPDGGGPDGLLMIDAAPPSPAYVRASVAAQAAGLAGEEAAAFVRKATVDAPRATGPAAFLGYIAPEQGAETATLFDADGSVIARTEVQHGLYEFRVADVAVADPRTIRLDGDALAAPITLGPFADGRR